MLSSLFPVFASVSSQEETTLRTRLTQLECHFTWDLRKEDLNLTDLLNRLEDQRELDVGGSDGVVRTYTCLGYVKFLLGADAEALANFQRSVEVCREMHGNESDQLLLVSYGDLAWQHLHMENYAECESYLKKLDEIKERYPPGSSTVSDANVFGEKGWTYLKFSRRYYEKAKECFTKALELEPEGSEWNSGLAIVLFRTETEVEDSNEESTTVTQLRRAMEMNPDDDVIKVLLALKLCIHKRYREADSLVQTALERSPEHPHVIRYVGKFLRERGSVGRSTSLLKKALERTPNSAFIHHQLALCYKRTTFKQPYVSHSRRRAAISSVRNQCIYHLEKAIEIKPSFILALAELALQYGENRDLSRAEETFQLARQFAEEKNEHHQVFHHFYGNFQHYIMRRESLAIEHYTKCLRINPNTFDGRKSVQQLKKIADRRIENDPEDGDAYGLLGLIYKEQGDTRRAQESYEKALQYVQNDEYLSNLCKLQLAVE